MNVKQPGYLILAAILLVTASQPGMSQQVPAAQKNEPPAIQSFGGPGSVQGQIADDERLTESLAGQPVPQGYFDWKAGLRDNYGLTYSLDYTAAGLAPTNTTGTEDFFAGGAVRFFGAWDLIGRESGNTGTFVWKIEHRHKYTDIPPQGAASQIGYVGLILPVLSDIGTRLTNLYWKQNLAQNRVEIVAGMLDVTDWVDIYALASPWNGFFNFAFATGGAAIPLPDDATLGVYVNGLVTDNFYISAGFADSNADSTEPFDGFDTFFNDREYFKSIEFGWVTSRDRFYLDNTHITFWHADERDEAGVPDGWGANFSFSKSYDEKWMPFIRAGYAKDAGTLLEKTLSAGLGYHFGNNNSLLGLGLNWGEPNETTFGPGLDDQFTVELFSRLQVFQNFQLTPDIQYIRNPARNTEANHSWVFGLRARLVF